jgi:hypothetical protein
VREHGGRRLLVFSHAHSWTLLTDGVESSWASFGFLTAPDTVNLSLGEKQKEADGCAGNKLGN